ncbi:hypothetical protein SAY87_011133 [Trapa incisa]|uniref:Glycosyltransferases n=1 Tax=Trapa incisa TaxID=236973 RepID=A0AAN7GFM9_9MYRT|nr:hypothetical protein SAY87_011133 [Trapa incisa]
MLRQSPSRNLRKNGFKLKVKHAGQICLLLTIFIWLLHQVKHSHFITKEHTVSSPGSLLNGVGVRDMAINLGRKDISSPLTGAPMVNGSQGRGEGDDGIDPNDLERAEEDYAEAELGDFIDEEDHEKEDATLQGETEGHLRIEKGPHDPTFKLVGRASFKDSAIPANCYGRELFENLRQISRFGTWPIAMLASFKNKAILEGPVCNGSQVIGWHTNEKSKRLRRFHVDMSGFAFNSTILWDPKIWRWPTRNPIRQLDTVKEGFQETTFIEQLVEDESQMEALPPTCLMILNWHLHLDAQDLNYPKGWLLQKNLEAVLPIE